MATQILAVNPPEVNTKTIEISGRLFQIAKITPYCWLLTDPATGDTKQFAEAPAMWRYIGAIRSFVPDLSIPQLPANIPDRPVRPERKSWNIAWILTTYPKRLPSQGVVALPASVSTQNAKEAYAKKLDNIKHQRALDYTISEFLKDAEAYFKAWNDLNNRKLTPYDARGRKWDMDCAFQNMSHKAFTYAQMVGQGA
jgi:hypothetical protein